MPNSNSPCLVMDSECQAIFHSSKMMLQVNKHEVQELPPKTITIEQYKCRRESKPISKIKSQNEFLLTLVKDQEITALQFKQFTSNSRPCWCIVDQEFLQESFSQDLFGERQLSRKTLLDVTGYRWQGFVIQEIQFSNMGQMAILTCEMGSPLFQSNKKEDIEKTLHNYFDQLLRKLVNDNKKNQIIFKTCFNNICKYLQTHPEYEEKKSQGKELNFNFIKYAQLIRCQANSSYGTSSANGQSLAMEIEQ